VFQELYSQQPHFGILKTALTQAKFPPSTTLEELEAAWPESDITLKALVSQVMGRLKSVKNLSNVKIPDSPLPAAWLLSASSYEVTNKLSQKAVTTLCRIALDEASPSTLDARRRFLETNKATSLRRVIWLTVNRILAYSPSVASEKSREVFWDRIPDNLQTSVIGKGVYSEEVAIAVGRCFKEDTQDLQALGDHLTSSRAMANNKDSPQSEWVMDEMSKGLVDLLLEVWVLWSPVLKELTIWRHPARSEAKRPQEKSSISTVRRFLTARQSIRYP
jgi:hypothetical protein